MKYIYDFDKNYLTAVEGDFEFSVQFYQPQIIGFESCYLVSVYWQPKFGRFRLTQAEFDKDGRLKRGDEDWGKYNIPFSEMCHWMQEAGIQLVDEISKGIRLYMR